MPDEQDTDPRYLVARIRDALTKDSRVNELALEVTVSGGKVLISGTVPTEQRRWAVADVAREVAPRLEIRNATEVVATSGEPRVEAVE